MLNKIRLYLEALGGRDTCYILPLRSSEHSGNLCFYWNPSLLPQ